MSRSLTFGLYFLATFLLAGAYGLTFMLPKLFAGFGADEKYVGTMLLVTTFTTLLSVYYAGHITDRLGRMNTLSLSGVLIAIGLFLFGLVEGKGITVATASAALGAGWGLMYSLTPVVLTRVTAESDRVRYFSLFSVFMMAGFGLSPVMASLLIEYGLTVSHAFIVSAVMCLIGGILFFLIKPSIRRMSASAGDEARSSLTLRGVGQVLSSRARTPVIMVWLGASVFAGMNNFQTVFADAQQLNYSDYFLAYTITVVVCRMLLARFNGGRLPYATISGLQFVMCASVVLFIFIDGSQTLYMLVAILFGIGYGASYPILAAMAANDADRDIVPQTLQFFALTYFVGIFGFPLVAGWMITEQGITALLVFVAVLAFIEASMALYRCTRRTLNEQQA